VIRPAVVRAGAEREVKTSSYIAEASEPLDEDIRTLFEGLLALLARDGVTVTVWRTPVHPLVYAAFVAHTPRGRAVAAFDDYCRGLAVRYGVNLIGSFNPGEYALGEADFYDALHPSEQAITEIVKISKFPKTIDGGVSRKAKGG
jgi:hypothetical protein